MVKERVYTLEERPTRYDSTEQYVLRNGNHLYCPFQQEESFCGDWCPAFEIHNEVLLTKNIDTNGNEVCVPCVKLSCFPHEVVFEIKDGDSNG